MSSRRGALLVAAIVAVGGLLLLLFVVRSDDESVGSADPGADSVPDSAVAWGLVDAVPAHQKSGIFVRTGLDYEPLLDESLSQHAARLTLTQPMAMLAMAPVRYGQVPFDQITLSGLEAPFDGMRTWLFVIVDEGALTVFVEDASIDECTDHFSGEEPFADYGVVGDIDGRFAVSTVDCRSLGDFSDPFGALLAPASTIQSFGALFAVPVDDVVDLEPFTVASLALTNSAEPVAEAADVLTVELVAAEVALAARTTDTADDASLSELHVLGSGGERQTVAMDEAGTFTVDLAELPPRIKIWFDDYGLEHYVRQGAWVDTTSLTRRLEIDLTPEFEPLDTPPELSPSNRNPHQLRIWNGSSRMEAQEYEGMTFTNNFGRADRDRSVDNPNDCARVAYLGGSYAETIQTRVDQKAGIIAEATLSTRHERCIEVFTIAQSVFTVESHYANVVSMIEDFGVDQLIFTISASELCRMDDRVFQENEGVAPDTPRKWRYIDGEFVAPFRHTDVIEVESDPDFVLGEHCNFAADEEDLTVERALFQKLADLLAEYTALDDDIEMTYFLMKDPLVASDDRVERVDFLLSLCDEFALPCVPLPLPEIHKPDELSDDFSPFLYRYLGDGHPNPRANQYVAEAIVSIIESALPAG